MKEYIQTSLLAAFVAMVSGAAISKTEAQAYCALRDPVKMIHQFVPDSSGHRSIIEVVRATARTQIGEQLPFTLHFNELGKHTLYVILKNDKPHGLVHARSEKGKWGMIEIVWYLDLNLNVQGYSFQRCRDRKKSLIENPIFASQLKGKGFQELREMLDDSGTAIAPDKLTIVEDAEPLAITTLRSALKTIAVTGIVWREHLLDMGGGVQSKKASAEKAGRWMMFQNQARLLSINHVYTRDAVAALNGIQQKEEWIIDRKSVAMAKAMDGSNKPLGLFIETQCTADEALVSIRWTIDSKGRIVKVAPAPSWPSPDIKEAFTGLEALSLDQVQSCSTAGQMAAAEILVIAQAHLPH